jgi:hypothetical protein
MALGTIGGESRCSVIDRYCVVIISGMAGNTRSRGACKVQINVAVLACRRAMLSNQNITGFRVVKFHGIG